MGAASKLNARRTERAVRRAQRAAASPSAQRRKALQKATHYARLLAAQSKENASWERSGRRTVAPRLLSQCHKCNHIGAGHYCAKCGERMRS